MKRMFGLLACMAAWLLHAELTVSDVQVFSGWPWKDVVIGYTIAGTSVEPRGLKVIAHDLDANRVYEGHWLDGADASEGRHVMKWDAQGEGATFVSSNVAFTVQVTDETYLVVDLAAGASAAAYPVTTLAAQPFGGFNTNDYKTTKLVLRQIPAGSFNMRNELNVTLTRPYYMGLFEVTQKQYERVTGATPSFYPGDTHPVERVSYEMVRGGASGAGWPNSPEVDATSFLGLLRARTGIDFDLPTEAQWEYACRAGTTSAYNNGGSRMNSTGSTSEDLALLGCYKGNSGNRHAVVGSYLPNAWNLYDMHGNVYEFCLDWWTGSLTETTNPRGPGSGMRRIIRGGSYSSLAGYCTSYDLDSGRPSDKYDSWGFRLASPCPTGGAVACVGDVSVYSAATSAVVAVDTTFADGFGVDPEMEVALGGVGVEPCGVTVDGDAFTGVAGVGVALWRPDFRGESVLVWQAGSCAMTSVVVVVNVKSDLVYTGLRGTTHANPSTYIEGTPLDFQTPSELTGYTFAGWSPSGVTAETTGDLTVRASWTANAYQIVYNANGGAGEMAPTECVYDQEAEIAENGFARAGCLFLGWAEDAEGEVVYAPGTKVTNLTAVADGVVELFAVWEREEDVTCESALDAEGLENVATGGDAEWAPVTGAAALQGGSCVQSGAVGMGQETWLEATVTGKGTLTFWWRTSCESDPRGVYAYDHAAFSTEEGVLYQLDGETDWIRQTVEFTTGGVHTLRWTYSTDRYEAEGFEDCMWVDGVVWDGETICSGVAQFVGANLRTNENATVTVRVAGGNYDRSSSVKVYLKHGPTASADIDVNKTVVDGKTAKKVTFPVTLKWAKGDVGEKTVVLKLRKDSLAEGPESFTLQLGGELGLALGEARTCTVTVDDASANPLRASVKNPKKTKGVAKIHVETVSANEDGGAVAGTGDWYKGAKLTVKAKAKTGYAFAGWYRNGTKVSTSANYAFMVKSVVTLEARFSKRCYLRALADPADGGTISGGGWFAKGKTATLKTVAKTHFKFLGWYAAKADDPNVVDTGRRLSGSLTYKPVVTNDTTVFACYRSEPRLEVFKSAGGSVSGANKYAAGKTATLKATPSKGYAFVGWYDAETNRLSLATSYKYKMGASNTVVTAQFKKESALAAPTLSWNASTNLVIGVSYSAAPKASGEAAVKIVSVTGLPAGLAWKSGKASGVPTTAKTNTVSVKVALATNAKKTWTLKQRLVVGRLPTWATGTFNGGFAEGSKTNQTTLTVSSAGKVSGKLNDANAAWTLSASSYASLSDVGTIKVKAVKGKTSKTFVVTVGHDELGGYATSATAGYAFDARQNLWAKDEAWKTWAAALNGASYTNAVDGLVVKFGANGTATAKIKSGSYTFSGSAVLCPAALDADRVEGFFYLYFAPNTAKKFKGAVRVVAFEEAVQ